MSRRISWSAVRTVVAVVGLLISAGALALACLDYAGESAEVCKTADGGACTDAGSSSSSSSGAGSGS